MSDFHVNFILINGEDKKRTYVTKLSCHIGSQRRAESSVNTNLPLRAFGIGQRLTGQPEVAFLKSKAGQQLWSLCLEFVEVPLFDSDRWQKHCPLWKLTHCRRKRGQRKS